MKLHYLTLQPTRTYQMTVQHKLDCRYEYLCVCPSGCLCICMSVHVSLFYRNRNGYDLLLIIRSNTPETQAPAWLVWCAAAIPKIPSSSNTFCRRDEPTHSYCSRRQTISPIPLEGNRPRSQPRCLWIRSGRIRRHSRLNACGSNMRGPEKTFTIAAET